MPKAQNEVKYIVFLEVYINLNFKMTYFFVHKPNVMIFSLSTIIGLYLNELENFTIIHSQNF